MTETRRGAARQKRRRIWQGLMVLALGSAALVGITRLSPFDRESRLQRLDLESLRRAALARPNDAELFLTLGRRLRQTDDLHKAFVITNHAYDLNDHSPRFVAAMTGALVDAGEFDSAYRLGKDAAARWPGSGEVRAQFARVYAGRGYFADALREAEAAVRLAPRHEEAWQALGNACSLNKRPVQAYAAFERALKLEPRDAELLADYGEALARYGRASEAEARLAEAVSLAPRAARPLGLLGQLQASHAHSVGERAAARALLERARARAPKDAEIQYHLALLDIQEDRNQEAIHLLKSCLALDPRYGEAYLALGQVYRRTGQTAAARQAYAAWQRFSDSRREEAHLQLRLRRTPGDIARLRRLARLHAVYGRLDLAEEDRRRIQAGRARMAADAGTGRNLAGGSGSKGGE